eukprot:7123436-Pyramimonas_sp.AAC.1
MAHFARSRGMQSATLAADLDKFYERICHAVLVAEAEAVKFPSRLCRAACSLYSGPRAVSFNGCVSV